MFLGQSRFGETHGWYADSKIYDEMLSLQLRTIYGQPRNFIILMLHLYSSDIGLKIIV